MLFGGFIKRRLDQVRAFREGIVEEVKLALRWSSQTWPVWEGRGECPGRGRRLGQACLARVAGAERRRWKVLGESEIKQDFQEVYLFPGWMGGFKERIFVVLRAGGTRKSDLYFQKCTWLDVGEWRGLREGFIQTLSVSVICSQQIVWIGKLWSSEAVHVFSSWTI